MRITLIIRFLISLILITLAISVSLTYYRSDISVYREFLLQEIPLLTYNFTLIEFTPNFGVFPDTLIAFTKLPDLSVLCYPTHQGLSDEEAAEYLSYFIYPTCKVPDKSVLYETEGGIFINCEQNKASSYYLDPKLTEIFGKDKVELTWKRIDKTILLNTYDSQFVFIKCSRRAIYSFVFNKFNSTVSSRANSYRTQIETKFGLPSTRPLALQILVIDSLSRQNFYRTQQKTLSFLSTSVLQGKYSESFTLYDFLLTNSISTSTKPNMIPVLFGEPHTTIDSELSLKNPLNESSSPVYLEIQQRSLWAYLSSLGYVTMFAYDTIWDFLSTSTGKVLQTDHSFFNFWKAASKVYGYNDFSERQRCFGPRNAHWYQMNYTLQYLKNYVGHNRFAYTHYSPAHESTGVIRTLDGDLQEYLESLLGYFAGHPEEDFALLLMSDHGRGVGRLEFTLNHFTEHRLPLTMLITNKALVNRMGAAEILQRNTKRLIGRFDLHLTLKTLGLAPYGKLSGDVYREWKARYPVQNAVSLFMETASEGRGCAEVGTAEVDCICKRFEKVGMEDEVHRAAVEVLVELVGLAVGRRLGNMFKCGTIEVYQMGETEMFEIKKFGEGASRIYRSYIHTPLMVIEATGHFATLKHFVDTRSWMENLDDMHPKQTFEVDGSELVIQLAGINIVSSLCGALDSCLCVSPWTVITREEIVTCNYYCEINNMKCGESIYLYRSLCDELSDGICICIN